MLKTYYETKWADEINKFKFSQKIADVLMQFGAVKRAIEIYGDSCEFTTDEYNEIVTRYVLIIQKECAEQFLMENTHIPRDKIENVIAELDRELE